METPSPKKVNYTSSNISEEKLEELSHVIPEAFIEKKIDWEKLRTILGDNVEIGIEKFSFTWAGKSDAIKNVLQPSKATLTPNPDESVKFDDSQDLFIEGENLEVLKLLQKAYFEKVKMIYIDPPYNTGGDFVYKDNFSAPLDTYLKNTGQRNESGEHLTTNKETNGRFHSDWLSMMYPRLKLAWNLLRDDGVIFVSIGDEEAHHLRMLMDEIYGEENFIGNIAWESKTKSQNTESAYNKLQPKVEHIFAYTKASGRRFNLINKGKKDYPLTDEQGVYREYPLEVMNATGVRGRQSMIYEIQGILPPPGKQWKLGINQIATLQSSGNLFVRDGKIIIKKRPGDEKSEVTDPFWAFFSKEIGTAESAKKELTDLLGVDNIFDTVKPVALIQRLVFHATQKDDLILDFFAGSGTTAHAVMAQNAEDNGDRQWILVQLPEKAKKDSEAFKAGYKTISDIAKERIRRAEIGLNHQYGFKVFKLTKSNYPENAFEFDPNKTYEENQVVFEDYLKIAKQNKLIDDIDINSIIYENIVKEGYSLNSKIQESAVVNNKIYTIIDGARQFSICLDRIIDDATVKNITERVKDATFICFDNALDDSAKANLSLHIELKTI